MRELLKARLKAAGVAAEAEQVEKLAAFHELLTEANARMNLTRVSADPAEAIDRNYLDSLAPLPHLSGAKTCVDVGSGAGFPGVPLCHLSAGYAFRADGFACKARGVFARRYRGTFPQRRGRVPARRGGRARRHARDASTRPRRGRSRR